jgi:hypothetical protein
VSNGLGSPLCEGTLGAGELSRANVRNCETSGFVAAVAPTADYGIDVHINTGLLGANLDTITQDIFVTPIWMALVWAVHALVVMLEWGFTIDLLDSPVASGIGGGLRAMQRAITDPWLASVLAVASLIVAYNGLVRRRVVQSVGEAVLALGMMAAGMWVILDPTGTVGALGAWVNETAVGTLGVTVSGTPSGAGRSLAESMSAVFETTVEVPWCYLEFGDVAWCRDRDLLDPQLRAAGLTIASGELSLVGCRNSGDPSGVGSEECASHGSSQARALEHSAQLLRAAQSNGALFLALPANGPARNSINETGSLLHALCQSSEATSCRGPTAAQAEFRTGSGTWSRVGGLVLIVGGALGLLLLFGFIALRLLGAAIFTLMYLLLAPMAVLAPALGESGRNLFRRWAGRLFGAVVSKLLYSFLLGVLLAVVAILADLHALGWWTQWLLMSAFWWGAFAHRHQALAIAGGALGREIPGGRGSIVSRARETAGRSIAERREKAGKRGGSGSAGDLTPRERRAPVGGPRPPAGPEDGSADEVAVRTPSGPPGEGGAGALDRSGVPERLSERRAQLARLLAERDRAELGGDRRRVAELSARARRVEGEISGERRALNDVPPDAAAHERQQRRGGTLDKGEHGEDRERLLQAGPASGLVEARLEGSSAGERDYAALAGLVGYGREEYERLSPQRQRAARLQVDRELALRSSAEGSEHGPVSGTQASAAGGRMDRSDPARGRRPARGDAEAPKRAAGGEPEGGSEGRPGEAGESPVMRDAHEVAARRKRQLGFDRP